MANIARLGVALGLNSAEFVSGIAAAEKKLDHFATAAVGVAKNALLALGAALSVATYKAVGYADEIADVAAANDIAIDSIIKLTNALENSGGKGANAGKMIASFTDFVDKAAKGSFEGQKTFSDLGISLRDIGNMSTQDLLLKTTQAIAGIEDPLTRSARAADAFGKASKGVDMVDFAKGLKEGKGATLEQEKAIKDAAQAFDLFKSIGRDISLLITETLGPSLLKLGKYLKDLDISNLSFTIFGKFIGFGTGNDPTVRIVELSKEIAELGKQRELALGRPLVLSTIDREILALQREQDALIAIQRIKADEASKSQTKEKTDGPIRKVTAPKESLAKEFELEKLRLEHKFSMVNKFLNESEKIEIEKEKKKAETILEIKQKNISEENKFVGVNSLILTYKLEAIDAEYKEKQAARRDKYREEEAKQHEDLMKEIDAVLSKQRDVATQREIYVQNYSDQIAAEIEGLKMAQEIMVIEQKSRYMKSEDVQLEKELVQIKYKHAEATLSIYKNEQLTEEGRNTAYALNNGRRETEIALAKERMQILKSQKEGGLVEGFLFRMNTFGKDMETSFEAGGRAFDSMMGSMSKALDEFVTTGKLNFGDFAKSIIKDMLAIQLRASANNLFAMIGKSLFSSPVSLAEPLSGARANGGPVESGGAYMVGERGPELFVPRSAGAIVPNHSMAMGGSTNITNYNIQAIDTKSFEDRILGSSKAVWAANAYGAKNLSLGRGRT
jgi:lambda family phage tail tape measure protein